MLAEGGEVITEEAVQPEAGKLGVQEVLDQPHPGA